MEAPNAGLERVDRVLKQQRSDLYKIRAASRREGDTVQGELEPGELGACRRCVRKLLPLKRQQRPPRLSVL